MPRQGFRRIDLDGTHKRKTESFPQLSIFSFMQDFDLMFTNGIPYVGFLREEPFFPRGGRFGQGC